MNHLQIAQKALKAAVTEAGSQSALARILGVSQRAVWRWVTEGKPLPAQHVEAVSLATGVSMKDLRPDLPIRDEVPAPPHMSAIDEGAR